MDKYPREVKRRAPRRTTSEVMATAPAWRSSGLTQEAFAQREGLTLWQVRNAVYRKALHLGEGSKPVASSGFIPVRMTDTGVGTVTVRWPGGMEVEVCIGRDTAGVLLRELLKPCSR